MLKLLCQQKEEHHEQGVRRQWNEPREGKAVPDSEDSREAARKRLADDRKREYQEMRDKVSFSKEFYHVKNRDSWPVLTSLVATEQNVCRLRCTLPDKFEMTIKTVTFIPGETSER